MSVLNNVIIDAANDRLTPDGNAFAFDADAVGGFVGSLFIGSGGGSLCNSVGDEGYYNQGFGNLALENVSRGKHNTAAGSAALCAVSSGSHNVAFGSKALVSLDASLFNAAFGFNAGRYVGSGTSPLTDATGCVLVGAYARASANGQTNEIAIGYGAISKGSHTAIIGGPDNTDVHLTGKMHSDGAAINGGVEVSGDVSVVGELSGGVVKCAQGFRASDDSLGLTRVLSFTQNTVRYLTFRNGLLVAEE